MTVGVETSNPDAAVIAPLLEIQPLYDGGSIEENFLPTGLRKAFEKALQRNDGRGA